MRKRKIAIIGSGISGLSCAWHLKKKYEVHLFEKNDYFGGHSNTQKILENNNIIYVDTGFIVFNNQNYKNLVSFFKLLNIESYETEMSFSVSMNKKKFEYGGEDLDTLFAQRKNILNKKFLIMLYEIVKFYKSAKKDIEKFGNQTIDQYLTSMRYSDFFTYNHIYPMAASIWSAPINEIKKFPFPKFVNFFENHALFNLHNRPKWRTVVNGSQEYVKKIIKEKRIVSHLNNKVLKIIRKKKIHIFSKKGEQLFDKVILACHSNQSLNLIENPTKEEVLFLSKIRYQKNTVWLHSDEKFMPKIKKVWSAWNFLDFGKNNLCVTYWMNKLQNLNTKQQIFVSLNLPENPSINKRFKKINYSHPIFDHETLNGQEGLNNIQGKNDTWFCGAYFGNGFHEDGIISGLNVAEKIIGIKRPWLK